MLNKYQYFQVRNVLHKVCLVPERCSCPIPRFQNQLYPYKAHAKTNQYQQSDHMIPGSISEVDRVEQDSETCSIPVLTYICRHNKNSEKPLPQIRGDSQQLNTHSVDRLIDLWSPQYKKEAILGECLPDINDSRIETLTIQ